MSLLASNRITANSAVDSQLMTAIYGLLATTFHSLAIPGSQLHLMSESHYGQRSVGQSVLVSSPFWGQRPDFCYCQTVVRILHNHLSGVQEPMNSSSHFASWDLIHFFFCGGHYSVFLGCAIAEAVSRWLPTAAARVQSQVWSSGIWFVVDKVASGQVFSEYFGFPCLHQILHPHNHPGQVQ
jgi:hypothetical protein